MSVFLPKANFTSAPTMPYAIHILDDKASLDLFYRVLGDTGVCAIDTETNSQLDTKDGKEYYDWAQGARPFMATLCASPDFVFVTFEPELFRALLDHIDARCVRQLYQNCKFDLHHLREWTGYRIDRFAGFPIDDTMWGFRLHFPRSKASLKVASKRYVPPALVDSVDYWQHKVHDELKNLQGMQKEGTFWYNSMMTRPPSFADVSKEIMIPYAAHDAYLTLLSWEGLKETGVMQTDIYRQEVELSMLLVHVEKAGTRVDKDELQRQIAVAGERYKNAYEKFHFLCPTIDPFSNKDLADFLYNELGEEVVFQTQKGNPAVNEMALHRIKNVDIRDSLLETKRWNKNLTTLTGLKKFVSSDGCIHSNYGADRAKTGRFGSSNPNLQNVSAFYPHQEYTHARKIVKPEKGYAHLYVDFKQIEVVLFADYSKEPVLVDAIRKGEDVHSQTTGRMFGIDPLEVDPDSPTHRPAYKPLRRMGKGMTFTIQYGAGKEKIGGILKHGDADGEGAVPQEMVDRILGRSGTHIELADFLRKSWKRGMPVAAQFMKTLTANLEKRRPNPWIRNKFGRIIPVQNGYEYAGLNYLIQGTAADLMKKSMLRSWQACLQFCEEHNLRPWIDVQLFGTIHDELIFKVPIHLYEELAKVIQPAMCNWEGVFDVPIRVSFSVAFPDTSWAEKKEFKVAA